MSRHQQKFMVFVVTKLVKDISYPWLSWLRFWCVLVDLRFLRLQKHTMLLPSSEHGVLLLVPWSVCHVEEYHPEIWLHVLRVLCSHLEAGMFEAASEQSQLLHLWHLQLSLVCHQQLLLVWSLIINVFPVLLESLEDLNTRTRGSEYTGKNEF